MLTFFVSFFLIKDGGRIWAGLTSRLRPERKRRADLAGGAAWQAVVYYVRGTVMIAAIHATVIGITLSIMNAPLVAPLSLFMFLAAFVPLVGVLAAGALAILVVLATKGWIFAVVLLGIMIVMNQLEGHLLQPQVVGKMVRLHPLAVILVLAVGGVVAGHRGRGGGRAHHRRGDKRGARAARGRPRAALASRSLWVGSRREAIPSRKTFHPRTERGEPDDEPGACHPPGPGGAAAVLRAAGGCRRGSGGRAGRPPGAGGASHGTDRDRDRAARWVRGVRDPRSGLAARHGVTLVNAPGTIDSGYRGEIQVILLNTDPARPVTFRRGDRIAQLVVQRVEHATFREVAALPGSVRGEGGFGSTGGHAGGVSASAPAGE